MATLSFSFDTGSVPTSRITNALATNYGYQATIPDPQNPESTIANPETKAQFAQRMVKKFLIDNVKAAEINAARVTAEVGVTEIALT